jgi:hypothetical protein
MSRPVGVTASAIVAILGSLFVLLLAGLMVASLFIQGARPQPPYTTQFAIMGAASFVALAGIGIWTSVGLFRLRRWARISIIVFAGFIAIWAVLALLVTTIMPIPPAITAGTVHIFRLWMAAMFGIPLAIAVWWLVQFNTPSTKAAFMSPIPESPSPRPLSITVIAWALIIGTASWLFLIAARVPVFLFGAVLKGWTAGVIYAFFGALSLYMGKGLLDLRERARVVAIGWLGFSFVHMTLITLVPSLRARMLDLQRGLVPNQPNPIPFDEGMITNVTFAFTAILMASAIWFLVRNRAAFVRVENP